MTTMTTRSFLPNDCPLINALTCCANLDCNKKAEPFTLKMCTACRSAHYCDVDCQKTHRKHHKHQCKQDAQDIKVGTDEIAKSRHTKEKSNDSDCDDDNKLFQPILPKDDCPICTLPLPINDSRSVYMTCCGNLICFSCGNEDRRVTLGRGQFPRCPFCREPDPSSDEETLFRLKKRMEMNDKFAINMASQYYESGEYGLSKDPQLAFDLCLRSAELGYSCAYFRAAIYYYNGEVVAKDMVKEREYLKKAAKKGHIKVRHNLGYDEWNNSNYRVACRHWLISVAAGSTDSLTNIAKCYKFKFVKKEEYATALTSYIRVHKDEWSIERERAADTVAP